MVAQRARGGVECRFLRRSALGFLRELSDGGRAGCCGCVVRQGWPAYARETCYPLLLQVQWPPPRLSWLHMGVIGVVTFFLGPRVLHTVVAAATAWPRRRHGGRFVTEGSAAQIGADQSGVKLAV